MTRMEKETVKRALEEYAERHFEELGGKMAAGILTYWGEVVEAGFGTVKI